jgi:hypothetical protein
MANSMVRSKSRFDPRKWHFLVKKWPFRRNFKWEGIFFISYAKSSVCGLHYEIKHFISLSLWLSKLLKFVTRKGECTSTVVPNRGYARDPPGVREKKNRVMADKKITKAKFEFWRLICAEEYKKVLNFYFKDWFRTDLRTLFWGKK